MRLNHNFYYCDSCLRIIATEEQHADYESVVIESRCNWCIEIHGTRKETT